MADWVPVLFVALIVVCVTAYLLLDPKLRPPRKTARAMRAPLSTPDRLPARAAIIIIVCLLVVLAALWLFIVTKTMIAIGVGAVALLIAGAYALAYRHGLKPM